jgi:hypothetical protein
MILVHASDDILLVENKYNKGKHKTILNAGTEVGQK